MNRDTVRSLGIFSAVILVLFALVLGGIYFAKNRELSMLRQNTPVANGNQVAQNNNPNPEQPKNDQGQQPQNQPSQPAPATTPEPAPAPASESPANQPSNSQTDQKPAEAQTPPAAAPAPSDEHNHADQPAHDAMAATGQVPQTGISGQDLLMTAAPAMVLVYLAVALRRSRVNLQRQLLS